MGMIRLLALGSAAALAGALASAGTAQAGHFDIPGTAFSSGAEGPSSGTDAFGNPWTWSSTLGPAGPDSPGTGFSAFGSPGLGSGEELLYTASTPATNFEITFLPPIETSVSINQTPSPFTGGYNEFTRFDVCTATSCVEWTPVFNASDEQVSFFAPAGSEITAGTDFFYNVVFNQKDLFSGGTARVGFTAVFSGGAVPEASTWVMMVLGFAGLGFAGYRAKRKNLPLIA
jgi:hypothetical protein